MALTPEQAAAVEKIMSQYQKQIQDILSTHKQEVQNAVEAIDAKKSNDIKKLIESFSTTTT